MVVHYILRHKKWLLRKIILFQGIPEIINKPLEGVLYLLDVLDCPIQPTVD